MKNLIKKWLGITDVEVKVSQIDGYVGKKEEERDSTGWMDMYSRLIVSFRNGPETLTERYEDLNKRHEKLKKDFEELDKKFDLLERFLQIQLVKTDTEVQIYDWADKKHTEEFRRAKPYKEVKKAKEVIEDEDFND